MKIKLTIAALLILMCSSMNAGSRKEKQSFELRRHEISLSGAVAPTRYFGSYGYSFMTDSGIGRDRSLAYAYFDASTYEVEKTTLLWSLNYFYNINRLFAVGASFSYEGGSNSFYYRSDDSLVNRESKNILTGMAYFRISWLNRPLVRMYSLIGAGASYSVEGDLEEPFDYMAFQFSPVGISVGKALYGFAEVGIGIYSGVNLGIGYRF